MSEQEGNKTEGSENQESAAYLSSVYIKDEADTKADSQAYQQQREAGDAKVRQAVYDAMEGRQSGTKSLHAPDGSWGKAHYAYPAKTHTGQARSRYGGRQYGHKRTSSHTAHPPLHTSLHESDTTYAKGEGQGGIVAWLKWKLGWKR